MTDWCRVRKHFNLNNIGGWGAKYAMIPQNLIKSSRVRTIITPCSIKTNSLFDTVTTNTGSFNSKLTKKFFPFYFIHRTSNLQKWQTSLNICIIFYFYFHGSLIKEPCLPLATFWFTSTLIIYFAFYWQCLSKFCNISSFYQ